MNKQNNPADVIASVLPKIGFLNTSLLSDKKIVVAGAGHGGLVAATILAGKGYDVTVIESKSKKDIGHDWTDVFDISCFDDTGIPRPPEDKCIRSHSITYTNPHKNIFIKMPDAEILTNCIVDRKYLIKYLMSYALKAGVKFKFDTKIIAPIADENRVIGITVEINGKYRSIYTDLIIDAAGIYSPVRTLLPERLGILNKFGDDEVFSAFRGFYNKNDGDEPDSQYLVNFYHMREPGLSWIISEENYIDILVGKFSPTLTDEQIDNALSDFRNDYNVLGDKLIRGGNVARIPIRRTIPRLVCDGYAAVGDSAAMTIPIIGSGIANAIRAGKYLADAVIADKSGLFTTETLWQYQYDYFTNVGNKYVIIDKLRDIATSLSADDVDYLMEKEILSANELSLGKKKVTDISISILVKKLVRSLPKLPVLANAAKALIKLGTIKNVLNSIPTEYDEEKVSDWAREYQSL